MNVATTIEQHPRGATTGFELNAVRFDAAGRTILHSLTLSLSGGEVIGLVGQNGSGKSTLLKMLARQTQPTSGTIRFEDRPIGSWSTRDFARRIAYLPQDPPAGTGLLVRDLVRLGRYPWHGAFGRFTGADAAAAENAMQMTGTLAFADRDVDTLSGGERQRVWLAMLVAQGAGCLLLDEPISALDIAHQIEVLSLIRCLGHDRSLCVVVVLHDVNMAARFCDRIVALRDGRLVANEKPSSFMSPAALARVYGIDMEVLSRPGASVGVAVPHMNQDVPAAS
ncbi:MULTISPECIES: ABC transporter ATP-binding protein [unclassified Aureimonas]|uniref:ABC transporter ATP-binding protein n=1 Tax=unclassified Aureimonas TaxID=2615206 RepID=UPI0006F71F6E|nr:MULTISPECIES: ATP-binding cassette domain-containing protein [unclassified Aureimonas]KQT61889.1 iron-hydroxamate transporter ATP-binding subunit [Aureimonas sp. Leaf460]KQT61901.1 iron-hydroxamate transporter ATP-binding subunit [Aureimonas sp. Leaf427]